MATKRNPEEVWKHIEQEAVDDEIEEAASVSAAQAEKELAEAGFDVEAERERARAWVRELRNTPAGQSLKPPVALSHIRSLRPRPRRPIILWVAAAVAVVVLGSEWLSLMMSARGTPRRAASTGAPHEGAGGSPGSPAK
jgi:hypothetical protein